MPHAPETNSQFNLAWIRVIALAIAAFIFNTTEFIPIALLTDIGASFGKTAEQVGIIITIYAWIVALSSLPLMLLVGTLERKKLLSWVFILFIISHLVTFFASHFWILVVGRMGVAFSHAIFWSITTALAIRVAPQGKRAQALGILATGTALATVLGIPLGRIIGQLVGWRYTFLLIGLIALATLIVLYLLLPKLPSQNAGSAKSIPMLFKRPAFVGILIITTIVVSAHFTAYGYIEPYSELIAKITPNKITILLLIFGGAGIIASMIFSRLNAKFPLLYLPGAIALLALTLLAIIPMTYVSNGILYLSVIWGIAFTSIGLLLQLKVLELAPDATDIAMAIYSGIFNVGIGGGALIGNLVITHMGAADMNAGLANVPWVAFIISIAALIVAIFVFTRYRQAFLKGAQATQGIVIH